MQESGSTAARLRIAALMALASLLTGCPSDDEASLGGPSGSLAVGAYYDVVFGDACGSSSGGKMPSLCSHERLASLDSIVSEDTGVVRIVDRQDGQDVIAPTPGAKLAFFGVAPGKATVRAKGRFSDGSTREDALEITVKAVTGLKVRQDCNRDSSGIVRALPGESVAFTVYAMAGREELQGCIPRLLDSVPGLRQNCHWWSTSASWQAPQTAAQVPLTSRVLPKPVGTLRTLALSEITDVRFEDVNEPPYALHQPDTFATYVRMSTGKLPLCKSPPATLRTLTPEVCAGPQGETQWTRNTTGYVFVKGLREGRCQLQAGLDGQKWFATFTRDLFFYTRPDTSWKLAGFGDPCKPEGATTCSYGLGTQAVCKDARWSRKQECGNGTLCDFLVAGGTGCLPGTSCAACRGLRAP